MLESFLTQIAPLKVPPVPPCKTLREPPQTTSIKAVPLVPPVPPEKTKTETQNILFQSDRQKILAYMADIGETDQRITNNGKQQTAITCRQCQHFNSFNTHGSGAGICSAGVWSAGICRWAGAVHQCDKYQIRES